MDHDREGLTRRAVARCLLLFAAALFAATAVAQSFPARPVKLVVPYPPGGGTDVLARVVAPKLAEALGQPVIIDNRPGAGGTIGSKSVAQSPADGYTILIVNTLPHTSAAGLYAKLGYDPVKDFTSIGSIATVPYLLAVNPKVPAKSLEEFLAVARTGSLNYASAGTGSATHLAAELFKSETKVELTHVPYKGGGPAISDLLGGQVDLTFENILALMPYIKAGKLRGLAVTTQKRSSVLPDVPSVSEGGYPGFDVGGQFGLVAPAGTLPDVIAVLARALEKAVQSTDLVQQLRSQGSEPRIMAPAQFDALMKAESAKWLAVMAKAGIRSE